MLDIEQLVLEILRAHVMTSSSRYRGSIREHRRHCLACGHDLPWRDWEEPLQEHVAKVIAERLGA